MKTLQGIILSACFLFGVATASTGTAEKAAQPKSVVTGIYNPDPEHLWNRLHSALFVRDYGKNGKVYGQDTIDPLLWPDTKQFLLSGTSYETVLATLDEFLASGGENPVSDPLKRAILQHDLWAV